MAGDNPEIMIWDDPDNRDLWCVVIKVAGGLTETQAQSMAEEMEQESRVAVPELEDGHTVH